MTDHFLFSRTPFKIDGNLTDKTGLRSSPFGVLLLANFLYSPHAHRALPPA